MKFLYFIRWCFDLSRWQSYQKRITLLMIASVVLSFTTKDSRLLFIPLIGLWLELVYWLIKDRWNSFCEEQKDMITKIKGRK